MNKQTLVSLSLLILLAACQPETQSTLVTASSENSPASAVLAETQVTVSDTASSVVEVASAVAPSAPAAEPVASKVSKNAAANQVSAPAPEVQAPATKPATVAPAPAPAPAAAAAPAATTPVAAAATTPSKSVLSDADGRALAQKNGCFVCHGMDKKIVGPAWKDIATKYRGDASMEAKLITKVSKGGAGAWGSTPMPPNSPRVKAEDISSLVKFILSLQ